MLDYAKGDATGLTFPAHPDALRAAGADFLTEAFRRSGAISPANRVERITELTPFTGGSNGRKLLLSVAYAMAQPGLHGELFVKFSRDFTDPIRDLGREEMASEVRLAALARHPAFPISVPATYFADYNGATGTGLLITSSVAFGRDGIEQQLVKCADHRVTDPLAYYRTVLTALARLAGTHKSSALGDGVDCIFPFDPSMAAAADPIPWTEGQLQGLIDGYARFAGHCPQLLPAAITTPQFVARFAEEARDILRREADIKHFLHADPDYIALCHWNAQLDNAWFWRDAAGSLQCGLIDWGRVRQMNLAYALWGCLVGASTTIWREHLDELLTLFAREYAAHGGPRLDPARLRLHLLLYAATIGNGGIMIAPERILLRLPEAAIARDARDPVFDASEEARCFLHILVVFLSLWQSSDLSASLSALPPARLGGTAGLPGA